MAKTKFWAVIVTCEGNKMLKSGKKMVYKYGLLRIKKSCLRRIRIGIRQKWDRIRNTGLMQWTVCIHDMKKRGNKRPTLLRSVSEYLLFTVHPAEERWIYTLSRWTNQQYKSCVRGNLALNWFNGFCVIYDARLRGWYTKIRIFSSR